MNLICETLCNNNINSYVENNHQWQSFQQLCWNREITEKEKRGRYSKRGSFVFMVQNSGHLCRKH